MTCRVISVLKSLLCLLFHLLVTHNNFLHVKKKLQPLHSQPPSRKRQETNIKLWWKGLAIKAEKRHHLSNVQIKTGGGPGWVIIGSALWLVEDESPSWREGKCLGGKVKEVRGRPVICWFMAMLSEVCFRQTVIKMKLSPWWKGRGICQVM